MSDQTCSRCGHCADDHRFGHGGAMGSCHQCECGLFMSAESGVASARKIPRDAPGASAAPLTGAKMSTDRELWREREGDYYADSIHVTREGYIGINSGGFVQVKSVQTWASAMRDLAATRAERDEALKSREMHRETWKAMDAERAKAEAERDAARKDRDRLREALEQVECKLADLLDEKYPEPLFRCTECGMKFVEMPHGHSHGSSDGVSGEIHSARIERIALAGSDPRKAE